MRLVAICLLVLAGCPEHGQTPPGFLRDATKGDATGGVCNPSGGCLDGPECGMTFPEDGGMTTTCCGVGEQCVQGICVCGSSPACEPGDQCQSGGPIADSFCGNFCCGQIHGCPI